ncbi:L-2-amino-thiazoline-4-carboxylic acid hydrolase [Ochrobactrum sp. S1502_03]|uniref:L-2-amino-thiazoline-4-carboxylic acid hydrolase n=1 Tax=Ochrobactrum sp. S1502_03 TaxID=3108451 RepID=UPI00320BF218
MNQMPILERRRIEALVLKNVYEVLRERSGEEEAQAAIGEAVTRSAIEQGRSFAQELGHTPDLQDFADILPLWTKDDALEIEVLSQGKDHFDFNVKRCRYSEMYRDMGLGHIGHLLSCNRDGDFCIGYNPEMKLERTQTIMQGASHCDFRYTLDAAEKGA